MFTLKRADTATFLDAYVSSFVDHCFVQVSQLRQREIKQQ